MKISLDFKKKLDSAGIEAPHAEQLMEYLALYEENEEAEMDFFSPINKLVDIRITLTYEDKLKILSSILLDLGHFLQANK